MSQEIGMLGAGMNLITTIIGFGLSAIFIVFVCTRLICGRIRRLEVQQMLDIDSRIDLELVCTVLLHCLDLFSSKSLSIEYIYRLIEC